MNCPYCQNTIKDSMQYCDKCGQEIAINSSRSNEYDHFWDVANKQTADGQVKEAQLIRQERDKQFDANKKKVINIVLVLLVVICIIGVIYNVNATNGDTLKIVQESAIGRTYTDEDHVFKGGIFGSYCYIHTTVKFNNDGTLDYEKTQWDSHNKKKEYDLASGTYDYHFSITFLGKVYLNTIGGSYEVSLNDNGTIKHIDFPDE